MLASEGLCGLTDVVRHIDRNVVILDVVEHGESDNTASLVKCWPTQSLSHLCHTSLYLIVTSELPQNLLLCPLYLVDMVLLVWIPYCVSVHNTRPDE